MKSKMLWTLIVTLTVSMLVTALPPAYGAPSLLTQEELDFAAAVGTGEYAYWVDEKMVSDFGNMPDGKGMEMFRNPGSPAEEEAANWLVSEMTNIGLKNATKEPIPVHGWTFRGAYVQVVDPITGPQWLAGGLGGVPGTVQQDYADEDGSLTREIVYVGLGRAQDYEGKNVTGKLVAFDQSPGATYWWNFNHMQAELKGAIGCVGHSIVPGYQDRPGSIHVIDSSCRPTIPLVAISNRDFAVLKDLCEAGPTTVKLWCDSEVTIPDTGYNVVGYLPGTTHPDEIIMLGAIFDTYWYGAVHHTSMVAATMQLAKALVDSGYKPDRTLAFVFVSEEYGWTDTIHSWAIGSHWLVHYNHTDWGGRMLASIWAGDSTKGDYSVGVGGLPLTYNWRQSMLPLLDEYFTTHKPWSYYYVPATTRVGGMPSTWGDDFSYCSVGIPPIGFGARGSTLYTGVYHVNNDTMDWVSGESLAMTTIATGISAIRMDRAPLAPYNFAYEADLIARTVDKEALAGVGIPSGPITAEIKKLKNVGNRVWNLITSPKKSADADVVNALLMQTYKTIYSNLLIVGGWGDTSMFRHQQYQVDSMMLREAIAALKEGDAAAAMWCLRLMNGMWPAINVDYEVYHHFYIEGTMPDNPNLMWADQGREAHYTDVWHEYMSLKEKIAAGNTNYSDEIASLQPKYEEAVANLEDSVDILLTTLPTAKNLLKTVKQLLS